ncbi:hypothetical protein UPYG_G00161030 [Umbra pygmaea]|uniref:G domain-containing protein n=1 Tax=Umbra pygmaea TaxID=75934 RepID=A0ABD0WLM0_UMBPY
MPFIYNTNVTIHSTSASIYCHSQKEHLPTRKANMGADASTQLPPSPPPPKKEFDQEWRKTDWSKKKRDAMVDELKNFKLFDLEVGHLRCLLLGPIGAGKSSFINSVNNIFQGRIAHSALAATFTSHGTSFTKIYKTHYIKNDEEILPFTFNDVMGLEEGQLDGIHPDDLVNALKGHVPEGYEFKPSWALHDKHMEYILNPKLKDKVHCLVNVISADKVSLMSEEVQKKMYKIREKASELGIPQVIVMTMPDITCPLVNKDLKKIYYSKIIKEKMQMCSNALGVPMNCVLPVKNYHEETGLDNDMDILILNAMTQIMNFANDYQWKPKPKN